MDKRSTLFYILDNLNKENELYVSGDLTEGKKNEEEYDSMLDLMEFSPSDEVLARIFKQVF